MHAQQPKIGAIDLSNIDLKSHAYMMLMTAAAAKSLCTARFCMWTLTPGLVDWHVDSDAGALCCTTTDTIMCSR